MDVGKLEVELRSDSGKGQARKLRRTGRVPAVCYGASDPPLSLAVDPRALEESLDPEKRGNTLITLTVKGDGPAREETVLLKDYQMDPLTNAVLHVDFVRVDLSKEITVTVPVVLTGRAPGVKLGGIMHQVFRSVEVVCLPDKIPTRLEVDISSLDIGDACKVADLQLPAGVRLDLDPKQSVAVVVAPKAEKAAEEEAAEAAPAEGEGAAAGAAAGEGEKDGDKAKEAKAAARAAAKADKAAGAAT